MIIKKFQAGTETEAIMLAKEELGKDAIVMNIKTIKPKGLFKILRKTQVEVTAAVDENEDQDKKQESKVTTQFNDKINEKLHPEQKKEDEEAKALNEKLNSLAKLLEEQLESQKKEGKPETKKEEKPAITNSQKEETDYLNTLSVGTHTFEILWTDGSASTTFTVVKNTSDSKDNDTPAQTTDAKKDNQNVTAPETGDDTSVVWMFILFIFSGTGLIITAKKRRINLDSSER